MNVSIDSPEATEAGASYCVDAHHHFWQVHADEQAWRTSAHADIDRDYGPEDLQPELAEAGVDATVLMQSVDTAAENDRLAHYAQHTPTVAGVIGWLPLSTPRAAQAELERAGNSRWRGVRCLVARDPMHWLNAPDAVDLFRDLAARGLAWDVVPITAEQTTAVLRLARAVPELRIVVDHLARPPLDTAGWQPWADQVAELATCPNIAIKVSVGIDALTAWEQWQPATLPRYVAHVLEHFSAHRAMLASNWPVVLLRTSYTQAMTDLTDAVWSAGASPAELTAVRGGTAHTWYGLSTAPVTP